MTIDSNMTNNDPSAVATMPISVDPGSTGGDHRDPSLETFRLADHGSEGAPCRSVS